MAVAAPTPKRSPGKEPLHARRSGERRPGERPPVARHEPNAAILRTYLLTALALGPVYIVFFAAFEASLSLIAPLFFTAFTALAWSLRRREPRLSARLFLLALWTAPAWCIVFTGGLYSPLVIWLTPTPFVAGALLGRRSALLTGAMSTALVVAYGAVPLESLNEFSQGTPKQLLFVISASSAVALVTFYGYVTTKNYEMSTDVLRMKTAELERGTRSLQARERSLVISNRYLDRVIDSMNDCLLITSPEGTIGRVNDAATEMLGYAAGELIGRQVSTLFDEATVVEEDGATEDRAAEDCAGLPARLLASGVMGRQERTWRRKDGAKISVLLSGAALRGPGDRVEALVCVARDITERRQAEDYVQGILQASPLGLLVTTPTGQIERVNDAVVSMFGYSEQELVGQPIELLLPERRRSTHTEHFTVERLGARRATAAGRNVNARREDGSELAVQVTLSSATLLGRPVTVAAVLDRTAHIEAETARRRMENEIAHAAGMAEVATGVLHNVGNVVNSANISASVAHGSLSKTSLGLLEGVVALLDEHHADPASLERFLTEDRRGKRMAESLGAITKRLREEHADLHGELEKLQEHVQHIVSVVASQQEFARSMGVLEEVEVGSFLEKAIDLSGLAASCRGIRVECSCDESSTVKVEPHKLMQILINLLSNARHALDDTRLVEGDGGRTQGVIDVRVGRDGDDMLRISVADNGAGIAAENLTRIFSHGFTTKADGHGFGLHISATAAVELGGRLTAESAGPGEGAKFVLTLPTDGAKAA